MLASIIDRLTSLVSKYLVIGFFIPVLMFAFITGAILYHDFSWFREWARPEITGTAKLFSTVAWLIGLTIVAYLFSSVSTFLREILEGKHLLECTDRVRKLFQARQQQKLAEIDRRYANARNERGNIAPQKGSWADALSNAANEGIQSHKGIATFDPESSTAAKSIREMEDFRSLAEPLRFDVLKRTVDELSAELKAHDESVADTKTGTTSLRNLRAELLILFDYAEDSWSSAELRAFNERQSRFGLGQVAPTAMGNVALSMQSYALTRYQLNLEKFWGNLQSILASNKEFYAQLQDAKTQLDFLVTCCWLSILVTLGCASLLVARGDSVLLFLAIALGGPASAYLFYFLGVKNYQAFAELVRIGVDLYRFDLLDSLHVTRPRTARDERAIWSTLQRLSHTGAEGTELSYKPDAKTGTH